MEERLRLKKQYEAENPPSPASFKDLDKVRQGKYLALLQQYKRNPTPALRKALDDF
jgi:hypothetical protein